MVYRPEESPGGRARLDHIELYVSDAMARAAEFVHRYDFTVVGRDRGPGGCCSITVRRHQVTLVLTQGIADDHPASSYVHLHGDGVATIALRVDDAAGALRAAIAAGADRAGPGIVAFGDVIHTFTEGPGPGGEYAPACSRNGLAHVDHVAVCLESGSLGATVDFYTRVLGWRQVFEENIHVGAQAMQSKVVQSRSGGVTITLLQPMPGAVPGQIDDFLKGHGGSGVQHLAFAVPDIVRAVDDLSRRGVAFLSTPDAYYEDLAARMRRPGHPVSSLQRRGILADQDHDGQLFQIFTRSEHPRRTFFLEVIERQGATTFGSNNIRKLYEAVDRATREQAWPRS